MMKQNILLLSLAIYLGFVKSAKKIGFIRRKQNSAVIVPPTSPGSLGDDAMITAAVKCLEQQNINDIGVICYTYNEEWLGLQDSGDKISKINMETYFSPIYSWQFWLMLFKVAPTLAQYQKFYCLGADMIDGNYSYHHVIKITRLLSVASQLGLETTILGSSFNKNPKPQAIEALTKLPKDIKICARDSLSQQRLANSLNRPIKLVADVAFLLSPLEEAKISCAMSQWLTRQRDNNRLIIGINCHKPGNQTVDSWVKIYVDTIIKLYSVNDLLSFVLIPHDVRYFKQGVSDVILGETIFNLLPDQIRAHSTVVLTSYITAAEIKAITAHLDICLTGRMHLAVACLGQGIPCACITYQDKFEGLCKHFEIEGLTLTPEEAAQPGNLANFLIILLNNRQEKSNQIKLKLPVVKSLSQGNFD